MANIVSICGQRRSGKTYFSNLVIDVARDFGIKVERVSFAGPLKTLFCDYKHIGIEYLEYNKEEFRVELEEFSNTCKAEDPFLFTDMLLKSLLPLGNYIIDDLRLFDVELIPLLDLKVPPYRVYADINTRIARGLKPNPATDNSRYETDLDLPQDIFKKWGGYWVFNNKEGKDHLLEEARYIVRKHFLKLQ